MNDNAALMTSLIAEAARQGMRDASDVRILDTSAATLRPDGSLALPPTFWADAKKRHPALFGPAPGAPKSAKDMTAEEWKAAQAKVKKDEMDGWVKRHHQRALDAILARHGE